MKLVKMDNKGQAVGGIQNFILAIVGVAVVLAVGLIVLGELSDSAKTAAGTSTKASNATDDIIDELAGVPTWIGILITVALAFIVLAYFYTRR